MKRVCIISIAAVLLLAALSAVADGPVVGQISKDQEQAWVRYTVPLPKSISITKQVTVPHGSVAVVKAAGDDLPTVQAAKELTELVGPLTGAANFTITMVIGGPDAEALKKLKNSTQAYSITPVGENGLKLVGLTPRAVYYAAKTLQQLIAGKSDSENVAIPIVTVTDWPDMEDRGTWGTDNFWQVKWMGDRKMNWIEQISAQGVDKDGKTYATLKGGREPLVTEGPLYGMNPVPVILHLEQSSHSVLDYYPDLKGKSDWNGVMCYSQPKVTEIISDWIEQLCSLPHVHEVDLWMSENLHGRKGCQCDKCKATGVDPMVLEARAAVKAWQMARQRTGKDIGLRLLTSEATEGANPTILKELPKDVKLIYYHSLLTYTHTKQDMLRPYLAEWAKNGGWLSVCPSIGAVPVYIEPYTSAEFILFRMKEYLSKNVSGLLGYPYPRTSHYYFNTEASAEYSWNLDGRSPHEFAVSFAVRNGYKDAAKFADMADALGESEFDVYGCDWPWRASRPTVPLIDLQLKRGTMPGFGVITDGYIAFPFGGVNSAQQLEHDVQLADKAVVLAKDLGIPMYWYESLVTQGYARSLKALYDMKMLVKNGTIQPKDKEQAKQVSKTFITNLQQALDALPKWEKTTYAGKDGGIYSKELAGYIQTKLIDRMQAFSKDMGL